MMWKVWVKKTGSCGSIQEGIRYFGTRKDAERFARSQEQLSNAQIAVTARVVRCP